MSVPTIQMSIQYSDLQPKYTKRVSIAVISIRTFSYDDSNQRVLLTFLMQCLYSPNRQTLRTLLYPVP